MIRILLCCICVTLIFLSCSITGAPKNSIIHSKMAIKKSDLYSSLWASCDELRGGMIALNGKTGIGDKINMKIIQPLIDANLRLARSGFLNFNKPNKHGKGQAMVDRLSIFISISPENNKTATTAYDPTCGSGSLLPFDSGASIFGERPSMNEGVR